MLLRLCLSLTLALGMLQGTLRAAPPEDGDAGAFPSWRIQACPYENAEGVGFGAYRHLGGRWDIGCQLSTGIRTNHTDGINQETGYSEYDYGNRDSSRSCRKSIDLDFDLRRWAMKGDRWGWYVGPRVGFGYGVYHSSSSRDELRNDEWRRRTGEGENKDYRVGVNLVVGAEVTLFREMSVILGLRPLRYGYSWSKGESSSRDERSGEDPTTEVTAESDEGGDFTTDLMPEAFIVLRLR